MLRRHIPLLTLLAAFTLAAPPAGALEIIDDFDNIAGNFGTANLVVTGTGGGSIVRSGGDLVLTDIDGDSVIGTATWSFSTFDLTLDNNAADNFFSMFITAETGTWTATLGVDDGSMLGLVTSASQPIVADQANTFLYQEFIDLGVDFTTIEQIVLTLANSSAPGDSVSVDYLHAVPEPGSAALLTLGLFGLAAGTPRRRIAA